MSLCDPICCRAHHWVQLVRPVRSALYSQSVVLLDAVHTMSCSRLDLTMSHSVPVWPDVGCANIAATAATAAHRGAILPSRRGTNARAVECATTSERSFYPAF